MPSMSDESGNVRYGWVRHEAGDMVEMFDMSVKFDWPMYDPEQPGVSKMTVAGVLTAIALVTHGASRYALLEVEGATYHVSRDFPVFVWEPVD